jgi:uncharacterized membrane protein YraQ (UPF0718 family)
MFAVWLPFPLSFECPGLRVAMPTIVMVMTLPLMHLRNPLVLMGFLFVRMIFLYAFLMVIGLFPHGYILKLSS